MEEQTSCIFIKLLALQVTQQRFLRLSASAFEVSCPILPLCQANIEGCSPTHRRQMTCWVIRFSAADGFLLCCQYVQMVVSWRRNLSHFWGRLSEDDLHHWQGSQGESNFKNNDFFQWNKQEQNKELEIMTSFHKFPFGFILFVHLVVLCILLCRNFLVAMSKKCWI